MLNKKGDLKNTATNWLGVVINVLLNLQNIVEAVGGNWGEINWATFGLGVVLNITMYLQGKDKDGKAKKYNLAGDRLPMILMLPFAIVLMACSTQTVVKYDAEPGQVYGIDQTTEIVDALYSSYAEIKHSEGDINVLDLAVKVIPKFINAFQDASLALEEIKELSDTEISALVSIGDKYNMSAQIKQVFKVILTIVQTNYVFRQKNQQAIFYDLRRELEQHFTVTKLKYAA